MADRLGLVGGYSLHCYCDKAPDVVITCPHPGAFTGETFAQARNAARKAGWLIHRDWRSHPILCPQHAKVHAHD